MAKYSDVGKDLQFKHRRRTQLRLEQAVVRGPGGDLNTARSYLVGVGISTAALAAGGYTGSYTGKTEFIMERRGLKQQI